MGPIQQGRASWGRRCLRGPKRIPGHPHHEAPNQCGLGELSGKLVSECQVRTQFTSLEQRDLKCPSRLSLGSCLIKPPFSPPPKAFSGFRVWGNLLSGSTVYTKEPALCHHLNLTCVPRMPLIKQRASAPHHYQAGKRWICLLRTGLLSLRATFYGAQRQEPAWRPHGANEATCKL